MRLVRDRTKGHASHWATTQSIAAKLERTAEILRRFVREDKRDAGERPGLTTEARERLKA